MFVCKYIFEIFLSSICLCLKYFNQFSNIKTSLHSWDKPNLIMLFIYILIGWTIFWWDFLHLHIYEQDCVKFRYEIGMKWGWDEKSFLSLFSLRKFWFNVRVNSFLHVWLNLLVKLFRIGIFFVEDFKLLIQLIY